MYFSFLFLLTFEIDVQLFSTSSSVTKTIRPPVVYFFLCAVADDETGSADGAGSANGSVVESIATECLPVPGQTAPERDHRFGSRRGGGTPRRLFESPSEHGEHRLGENDEAQGGEAGMKTAKGKAKAPTRALGGAGFQG